jgi:hypothetical protein
MMGSQAVVYLNGRSSATKPATLAGLLRRLGTSRLAQVLCKPPAVIEEDPYLLVLLADQALDEGREQQAACLVDAAYAAFDQWANVTALRRVNYESCHLPRDTAVGLSTI